MFSYRYLVLPLFALISTAKAGSLPSSVCEHFDRVLVYYRNYFEIYLALKNGTSDEVDKSGTFYELLNFSVPACCPNVSLEFIFVNSTKDDVETDALVKFEEHDKRPREMAFYFPEFAENKERKVYDFDLEFVKLARSPGQAVVMLTPSSKRSIFLWDIFIQSYALFVFMIVLSCMIGILGWAMDHWKNPEEFPSPFIIGIFEGFWWSVVTMTTVGYGDKAPKSFPARVLAVFWTLTSAVLLSLFTANSTTILNASQQQEDYSRTIGKKIGVLQSKNFIESRLNLGAEIINYHSFYTLHEALINKEVDRFIFPNYKDLLIYFESERREGNAGVDNYQIAKVFDSPFQIGMVLSLSQEVLTTNHSIFLRCLRTVVSKTAKEFNDEVKYSSVAYEDNNDKETSTLNQDSLIKNTYYLLGMIAFLMCLGLAWDIWQYMKRKKANEPAQVGDIEVGQENGGQRNGDRERPVVTEKSTWF